MSLTTFAENYDDVNALLREPLEVLELPPTRLLVGSGEDCQVVLFGFNYKRIHEGSDDQ